MRVLYVVLALTVQPVQTAPAFAQALDELTEEAGYPPELPRLFRQLGYMQEPTRRGRSLQGTPVPSPAPEMFTSDLGYVGNASFQTWSRCRVTDWGVPRQIFGKAPTLQHYPLPTHVTEDYPNLYGTPDWPEVAAALWEVARSDFMVIGVKGTAGQIQFAAEFAWLVWEMLGMQTTVCRLLLDGAYNWGGTVCNMSEPLHVLISDEQGPTEGMIRLGTTGYSSDAGIYLRENQSAGVTDGSEGPLWYPDWYLSWKQDSSLVAAYPPLELEYWIRPLIDYEATPRCDNAWNANHPLASGRQWCNASGFFVPEQCDFAPCSVVYQSTPARETGWIESLIVSYRLPFVVEYLGVLAHSWILYEVFQPALLAREKPGGPSDLQMRVQFPISPPCTVNSGPTNPEASQECDMMQGSTWKWVSPTFAQNFPAAVLLLEKLQLDNNFMDLLLLLDDQITPEICFDKYWVRVKQLRELVGSCKAADQPVPDGAQDCVCHLGRTLNGSQCVPCPPHSYCPFDTKPQTCGGEGVSTVLSGRRRRSRGPSSPEDCNCRPGAGLTYSNVNGDAGCVSCPRATYKSQEGPRPCLDACPAHSDSEPGSIAEDNCTCLRGYYRSREPSEGGTGVMCTPCAEQGAECDGSAVPVAKAGYNIKLERVVLNETSGDSELQLRVFACPVPTSCLANNICSPGTGGKLCTVCQPGYVRGTSSTVYCEKCVGMWTHTRNYFIWTMVITAYVNYFGSVIGTSASKDINIVSMAGKIIFHHGFLTWLVANFPREVAWTSPVAVWLSRFQYDSRCLYEGLGFKTIPQRAVASVLAAMWLPLSSLITSLICCRLTVWYMRKEIAVQQLEVQRANEVITMCDWLEDLHVRDSFRMESIKTEFKGYRWDLITKARVIGIWRTINKDYNHKNTFVMNQWIMLYKFMMDSSGLMLAWLIVLHPFVSRDIVSVFLQYTSPDTQTGFVLGTNMDYLGAEHIQYLVPLTLVFIIYSCGLPVFCFYKIKRLHMQQRLLNMEECMRWGYLYYGLEMKSPQVFFEVAFIVQRTIMAVVVEEGAFTTDGFTSSLREAITLLILVLFSCSPPFEKARYHVLDNLMGRAILTCVVTPEVRSAAGGEVQVTLREFFEALQSVSISGENRNNLNVIVVVVTLSAVFVFNILFWLTIIRELVVEIFYMLFAWVRLLQAGATDAISASFIGRKLIEFLPQKWPEMISQVDSTSSINNLTPVLLLKKFIKLVVAGRERYLAISMQCKTTDLSHGGKGFLSIREIVIHEGNKKKSEEPPARSSENLAKLRISTAHASKAAADMAKALSYGKPELDTFRDSASRSSLSSGATAINGHASLKHFNDIERTDLAVALSEAIETLLVIHNLETLPFCVLEFIIADALYCSRMGRQTEINRRREVFEFVWSHPSGQVRGIEELFERTPKSPELSHTMRLKELKATAIKLGTAMKTEKLLVHDIQRYVRHLRFQDATSVVHWLQAFAEAVKEDVLSRHSGSRKENGAQTNFSKEQGVQTEGTVTQSAQTDAIIPTSGTHQHSEGSQQAGQELADKAASSRDELLRGEIESAQREAKDLEEETKKLLQAQALPAPAAALAAPAASDRPVINDRQPLLLGPAVGDQPASSEPLTLQPPSALEQSPQSSSQWSAGGQQQQQPRSPPAQQQAVPAQQQAAPAEPQAGPAQQPAATQPAAKSPARTRKKTNWIVVPK